MTKQIKIIILSSLMLGSFSQTSCMFKNAKFVFSGAVLALVTERFVNHIKTPKVNLAKINLGKKVKNTPNANKKKQKDLSELREMAINVANTIY